MDNISTTKVFRSTNNISQLRESDSPIFQEIAEVLKKHNALDRFGITLLHNHFSLTADEILAETTDSINRIQTIQPVPKSSVDSGNYFASAWRLDTGEAILKCQTGDFDD